MKWYYSIVPVLALAATGCGSGIIPDAHAAPDVQGSAPSNRADHASPPVASTSRVIYLRPPALPEEPILLNESALRDAQGHARSRTRDANYGASHEASKAIEAARQEQRVEGARSPSAEVSNTAEEVRGAMTVREVPAAPGLSSVSVSNSKAQRAAQKAMEERYRIPTRPSR